MQGVSNMNNSDSSEDYYLNGVCEGISVHRRGCLVWVYDMNSDNRYEHEFPNEEIARQKVEDIIRDLYALNNKGA